jgi:hypothetical protein
MLVRGQSEELEVVATYTNGTRRNVSQDVTWSVTPPSVATVSPDSLVTAQAAGTAQLVATLEGVSGSAALTVVDEGALTSLAITPTQATVMVAGQRQFQATAEYSSGAQVDVTSVVEWSSSSPGLATVSNAQGSEGVAQGRAPGSVVISARLGTSKRRPT